MRDYVIITDATADLRGEDCARYGIHVLGMSVKIGEEEFQFHPDTKFDAKSFYEKLKQFPNAKTSQVSTYRFQEAFESFVKKGCDVLYIGFASVLSGTFQNAWVARNEILEHYPDARIEVVDSMSATYGEALLVLYTAMQKEKGASLDEAVKFADQLRHRIIHLFTVDDLQHLARGGRLSNSQAMLGMLMQIKPILHCDDEGRLVPIDKVRGRKAAIRRLGSDFALKCEDKSLVCVIHADAHEDALLLKKILEEENEIGEVRVSDIGPVIGVHSGPQTLGIVYIARQR
jgi:DegV family protein with EDD domain